MFKFALCALDVRTHACDVVAQSGLLAIGEAADQQPFDPIAVRLEIGDDRVRLVGQDDALAAIRPFFSIRASTREAVDRVMQNFCSMVCWYISRPRLRAKNMMICALPPVVSLAVCGMLSPK